MQLRLTSTAIAKAFLPRLSVHHTVHARDVLQQTTQSRKAYCLRGERRSKIASSLSSKASAGEGPGRPGARRGDEAGSEKVPPAAARRDGEQRPAMAAAPRAGPSRTRGRAGPWRRARAAVRNPLLPPLRRSRARKVGPHSRQPGSAFSEEAAANRSRPTGGHRSASVPPDRGRGRPVRRVREGGRQGRRGSGREAGPARRAREGGRLREQRRRGSGDGGGWRARGRRDPPRHRHRLRRVTTPLHMLRRAAGAGHGRPPACGEPAGHLPPVLVLLALSLLALPYSRHGRGRRGVRPARGTAGRRVWAAEDAPDQRRRRWRRMPLRALAEGRRGRWGGGGRREPPPLGRRGEGGGSRHRSPHLVLASSSSRPRARGMAVSCFCLCVLLETTIFAVECIYCL